MSFGEPLKIGSTIGILGGGQLGRMLALRAAELGFDVHIYDPEPDCPAGRVAARCISAPWDDLAALRDFASHVDVITFEFENVPHESLSHLAALKPVRPSQKSLEQTQDRVIEKTFINGLGLATASYAPIIDVEDLTQAAEDVGFPAILKTNRFGYDGRGQVRIKTEADLIAAWEGLDQVACVLEGFVDFVCEVSVVLARSQSGATQIYDCVRNVHKAGILHTSHVPSGLSDELEAAARSAAQQIADALGHIGVLAVEFFVTPQGDLVVNEIAPRVHNSGHWTQDGCITCQFEQHIRAVALWPLADPARHSLAMTMQNLIGSEINTVPTLIADPNVSLHLYAKRSARPSRKMGHFTRVKRVALGVK
jgi:5-(carboxyamino)imidazole ribonucleotide synthase